MTLLSLPFKSRTPINLGLHSGAASGNLGLVKFALDNGQPVDSVVNGLLPIHAASAGGHVQVVKYLLERGADVNSRRRPRRNSGGLLSRNDDYDSTALHFAASNGNVELVILLLKWGAQVSVVDKYGSTPFSIAAAKKHHTVAMLLQKPQRSLTSSSMPSLTVCKSSLKIVTPSTRSRDSIHHLAIDDHLSLISSKHENKKTKLDSTSDIFEPESLSESQFMTSFSGLLHKKGFSDLRVSFSERYQTSDTKHHRAFRSLAKMVQKTSVATLPSCHSLRVTLFSASPVHSVS